MTVWLKYTLLGFIVTSSTVMATFSVNVTVTSSLQQNNRSLACPGDPVIYICETNGSALTWIIEPYIPEDEAVAFVSHGTPGESLVSHPKAIRVLISNSPTLVSQLVLQSSDNFLDTTIVCGTEGRVNDSVPHKMSVPPQPPSNVRKTILGNITEGNNTFQFVKIKWDMLNDSDVSHYQVEANASNTTLETLVDNRGNATVSLENVDSDFITVEVFSVNKCQLRSTTGTRATITIPRNIDKMYSKQRITAASSLVVLLVVFYSMILLF